MFILISQNEQGGASVMETVTFEVSVDTDKKQMYVLFRFFFFSF